MIYVYKDYIVEPEVNAPGRFNIFKEYIVPDVNEKTGEANKHAGETERRPVSYGMTMERCVWKLAHLENSQGDEVRNLKDYASDIKGVYDEILKLGWL